MTAQIQNQDRAPVLAVEGLNVRIASENGAFDVVSDMALSVAAGETVCIVGESGCGKSMTALALLRLLPEAASVAAGKIEI
ncbi:MAG: ATP-binding cassette domain-containing protein, partial [Devosia nanyangense]|nr:ATP-binding cassette domain-containing protein [Devosia nanyangense]